MQVNITFDPATEIEDVRDLLAKLDGEAASTPTPTPAKRAAAKKAAAAKPDPEPEPEPEPEETGPTLADAVARAQELVALKLTQKVKDAVKELGGDKVSNLKGDDIAAFIELVKDAEDEDDSVV